VPTRIAVLSPDLINKIAAGEVVERPASVVKELCENSLDAGARAIRVRLRSGGAVRVEVADDGAGMSREDALLALSRHATSKLRTLDDLGEIRTMGFRGEALPTIASVSRFSLVTAEPGAAEGTRVAVDGGAPPEVSAAAPVAGTVVVVEDLFFNTPARRKFLKRVETETRHCLEAVVRLALAHPEVAFHVDHDGRTLLAAPAGQGEGGLTDRITAALGPEVLGRLLPVEERRLGLLVRGVAASPELTLNSARGVYTFVNRRYVRDRGLNHAIQRAFSEALAPGQHPLVVLFLEVDPRSVDVNVHPQKLEVRFQDPSSVQEALHAGLRRALQRGDPSAQIPPQPSAPTAAYASAVDRYLSRAQEAMDTMAAAWPAAPGVAPAFGQARPDVNGAPPPRFFSRLRALGTLGGRFWVCEGGGGTLVVLDPHAARERAHLSALSRALEQKGEPSASLFTAQVELPRGAAAALLEHRAALGRMGLSLDSFGGTSVAVRSVPAGLERAPPAELLEAVWRALPASGEGDYGGVMRALACRAAAAQGAQVALEQERLVLFRQLDEADFTLRAEHPAVVLLEVPIHDLDRKAGAGAGSKN
jgi:DNA mismatch repair protein MutL